MVVCLKVWLLTLLLVLQFAYQEKMTKMVIDGSQLITGWYSEVTMLPLEGAAVAHKDTFFTMDRLIYYYIYALIDNCIPHSISPCNWNIRLCITQIACKLFCWSYNSYCRIYTVGLQQWSKVACLRLLILSRAPGVSSVEECRQVRRWVTNIAQGQYWFLLLLHGFIPPGPGQYRVLLPRLEEVT